MKIIRYLIEVVMVAALIVLAGQLSSNYFEIRELKSEVDLMMERRNIEENDAIYGYQRRVLPWWKIILR